MAKRKRGYFRYKRELKIKRKLRILNNSRLDNPPHYIDYDDFDESVFWNNRMVGSIYSLWFVKHNGELSKGKIHCSCELCTFHGPTMQDKKRMMEMLDDLQDCDESIGNFGQVSSKLKRRIAGEAPAISGQCSLPKSKKTVDYDEFARLIAERNKSNIISPIFNKTQKSIA